MEPLMGKCESCGFELAVSGGPAYWAHGVPSEDALKRSCPRCGGWIVARGTVYQVAGIAAQVLAASGLSEVELTSFIESLERARSSDSIDAAMAEVATSSPLGAAISRLFIPRTSADLAAWITVLLMLVQLYLDQRQPEPPSREDIAAIVAEALTKAGVVDERPELDRPPDRRTGGSGTSSTRPQ